MPPKQSTSAARGSALGPSTGKSAKPAVRAPGRSTAAANSNNRNHHNNNMSDSDDPFGDRAEDARPQQASKRRRQQQRQQQQGERAGNMDLDGDGEEIADDTEEEEEDEDAPKTIPPDLLTRLLHEFFDKEGTRISRDANAAVAKYMDIFVRETIARTALEKESGFLEVEDLEKVAPQLLLDL